MKTGDLVKIMTSKCKTYDHSPEDVGIIVAHHNEGIGIGGAWILWNNDLKPKLFARIDFLEIINESR